MSDLQLLADAPIGAVFFVSGTISVFVILAIFITKKGTDMHSIMGYVFLFSLSFSNYAGAMAYYEGLLPLAAISFTIPTSTISIILGIASILPKSKSLLRIKIHIISMCISTSSIVIGTLINGYHFTLNPLNIFSWTDAGAILILLLPFLVMGLIITLHFLLQAKKHHLIIHYKLVQKDSESIVQSKIGSRAHTILLKKKIENTKDKQVGQS